MEAGVAVARTDVEREAVLNDLMADHGDSVKRLCYVYLNDMALAEDAAQETFLKAWRGLDRFRGDSGVQTWLMRIAINICRDFRRSPWHRLVVSRAAPVEDTASFDAPDLPDDTVINAVKALPRKYKEPVLLFYYQGMALKEVAQALGMPVSSVSSRLVRARAKLKDQLREWYHEER